MDPANMVLAKALLLFGLGYAAVAQCVREKDDSCPTHQCIREIAIGGLQSLKGNMGRPKGSTLLKEPHLATMLELRGPKGNAIGYLAVYKKYHS